MALADRLNRIINEQQISKAEFARRIGVTPQYVLLLTDYFTTWGIYA